MKQLLKEIDELQVEIRSWSLSKETLRQIKNYYRILLTYTSNALEGNSLTESETKVLLEEGLTVGGKPIRDYYEAMGHGEAYELMHDFSKKKKPLTENNIKDLHKLFYHRIDEKEAGQYRKVRVFISGSHHSFPAPEKVPILMRKFVEELEELKTEHHPVDFAALVHKHFVFVHPFIDGNGRISRLLMNLALLQADYSLAIILPILRAEYIRTLEKAHTNDKDFRHFIAERVKETQKEYLRLLQG